MLLKALKGLVVALTATLSFISTSVYLDSQTFATPRQSVHLITNGQGSGSAVVIAPSWALTAAHVITHDGDFTIDGFKVVATWYDVDADLALVHVPGLGCPCTSLGTNPFPDDELVAIGYPLGKFQFATEGRMQGHDPEEPLSWASSPIIFGNSGGGVFSWQHFQWKLVGISVQVAGIPQGWNSAFFVTHMMRMVPASQINVFLTKVHNGDVERK